MVTTKKPEQDGVLLWACIGLCIGVCTMCMYVTEYVYDNMYRRIDVCLGKISMHVSL